MSYKILSKFIKDVSFEIPNANAFVMLEKDISNYNLNFDISSSKFKNNIIEVKNKVMAEINMAALVSIDENLNDKKELEKIILVKVPNEVYETLYETFVYLFSKAGIKNIKIQKEINFEKMYAEREKAS